MVSLYPSHRVLALLTVLTAAGCVSEHAAHGNTDRSEDGAKRTVIEEQCELLARATALLESDQEHLNAPILTSCPGPFEHRIRPEGEEKKFAGVLSLSGVPTSVLEKGTGFEALYGNFVLRGVPPDVALILSETNKFYNVTKYYE